MKRRTILTSIFAAVSLLPLRSGIASTLPPLTAYRNPGCGCCEQWAKLMTAAGFHVTIEDDANLDARRAGLMIPAELASCHIALAGGYSFEGHVPPADILKFLGEQHDGVIGLIVTGMPMG